MAAPGKRQVVDNPEASRYELRDDRELLALVDYRLVGETITMTHAEVEPALRGGGLGNELAAGALADAAARGLQVVAACPFIAAYLRRHPEAAKPRS